MVPDPVVYTHWVAFLEASCTTERQQVATKG